MKLFRYLIITLFCILFIPDLAGLQAGINPPSLEMKVKTGYLRIEAFSENILHITFSPGQGYVSRFIPVNFPGRMPSAIIKKMKKNGTLKTSGLLCEISLKSGILSIKDTSGKTGFLEALLPGELKESQSGGDKTFSSSQSFKVSSDEGLYGITGLSDTTMNRHSALNSTLRLDPCPDLPFLLSTKNYGVLWVNASGNEFRCSASVMSFSSENADVIDFFIITGQNAAEVMASRNLLKEAPPFLPLRAYGYWHSIEKVKPDQQILQTARDYRSNNIPVDVFAMDLPHPGEYTSISSLRDNNGNHRPGPLSDTLSLKYKIEYLVEPGPAKTGKSPQTARAGSSAELPGLKSRIASEVNACINGNPYNDAVSGWLIPSGQGSPYPFGIDDMAFREQYIRWFQFAVFCPVFRSPISNMPQEIYRFGEKGSGLYESILQWINFRYLILPYIYSYANKMHVSACPLLRPLGLEFSADKKAGSIENEFMFGPSFLIRPVTERQYYKPKTDTLHEQIMLRPLYDSVECYLPSGAAWFDLFTGRRFDGGQMISTPSPLEVIPVFVKAGSIIPYSPRVQFAEEKKPDPVDLRIYPGSDADFELYEDENTGINYKNGAYSVIPVHWDDKAMTITIGKRRGEFPGMLQNRTFRIYFISPDIPDGFATAAVSEKSMKYSGEQISLKIK